MKLYRFHFLIGAVVLCSAAGAQPFPPVVTLGQGVDQVIFDGAAASDLLGQAVSSAGDFNGDGVKDLVFSSQGADVPTPAGGQFNNGGEVYVLYGGRGGVSAGFDLNSLRSSSGGDGSLGFILQGEFPNEQIGTSLNTVGDVNGDGIDDLLVGAPFMQTFQGAGGAYLIFGRPIDNPMPAELSLSALRPADAENTNSGFGVVFEGSQIGAQTAVAAAGGQDVNGDGVADVVIGTNFSGGINGARPSFIFVVYGRPASRPWPAQFDLVGLQINTATGLDGFTIISNNPGNGLGASAAALGDFTGDGLADIGLGSPFEGVDGSSNGGAVIIPGRISGPDLGFAQGLDLGLGQVRATVSVLSYGEENSFIGQSMAGIGDVNKDGRPDLAVGGTLSDIGGEDGGIVFVLFGRQAGDPLPAEFSLEDLLPGQGGDGTQGVVLVGGTGNLMGSTVSALGDVSGDGIDDFIVGAPGLDLGGADVGGAYVVYGQDAFPALFQMSDLISGDGSEGFAIAGESPADLVGDAVGIPADADGDGATDIVIGSRFSDVQGNNTGRVYLIKGAGQPELKLDGNATRAWYDPDRPGEGVLTEVGTLDGEPALFVTWYTYVDGKQLWLAAGPMVFTDGAKRVSTDLVVTDGGDFGDAFDASSVNLSVWGTVEVELLACDRLAWRYTGAGQTGELVFVPLLADLLALPGCPASGKRAAATVGKRLGADFSGTWWNPDRAGEGIVIDVETRGDIPTAFFSWFTYRGGEQRWLVGSVAIDPAGSSISSAPLVVTNGADFGSAFDPNDVQMSTWGTATLVFQSCDSAVLSFAGQFPEDSQQRSGTINLVRFTDGLYQVDCAF